MRWQVDSTTASRMSPASVSRANAFPRSGGAMARSSSNSRGALRWWMPKARTDMVDLSSLGRTGLTQTLVEQRTGLSDLSLANQSQQTAILEGLLPQAAERLGGHAPRPELGAHRGQNLQHPLVLRL